MQISPRFLIELSALLATCACVADRSQVLTFRDERVGPCENEQPCELAGELVVQSEPGNTTTASIDQVQGPCVPLLLPALSNSQYHRWQGKHVRITGTALIRSRGPVEVTRVQYRDRWLLEGICGSSAIVVYVDRIVRER